MAEHIVDVGRLLESLGLERYASLFAENAIDPDVLRDLTEDDLKELGLPLGHRKKLLKAIATLGDAAPVSRPIVSTPAARLADHAERRQITVLFCDLVGSTALAGRLDPEDLRDLMRAYHARCAEAVERYDGSVAQYLGDGVMVRFGYPTAHEDDAERAIRCGLDVIGAVGDLRTPGGDQLQARIGIATGVVVVGDQLGTAPTQERAAVGETPNLAARLQGLAEPGAIVIAANTRQLAGGFFEYRPLGAVTLKGIADPVEAWQVLRASPVESRFEALRSAALTGLVGREEELELLLRRWRQSKDGSGRVVLLSGEPGIGKSRLTPALLEQVEAEPHVRLRYFCSPHHQHSALHPVISQLQRACGFERNDDNKAKLDKLDRVLAERDASR